MHTADSMPDDAPAAPQDSYGRPLPGHFERLTQTLNAIGTLWIVALMLLINADVLGRELFNTPVRGVTELVALSIVGIVFLQLGDTLAVGRMTRADILLDRLKRTTPWLAAALQAVFHGVGAVLMGVILRASWEPLMESIRIQEYVGAVGDFMAPVWPVRVIMLIGMAVTLVTFMLLAWMDLRRMQGLRGARP